MLAERAVADGEMVEIERRFSSGRDDLFDAWTNPQALKVWFGPDGVETRQAEVDLQVGGSFRIEMVLPSGSVVVHHGLYEQIVRPETLVFTWQLQDQDCDGSAGENVDTRVTVRFVRVDQNTTDLVLTHEGLPTKKAREGHEFGWNGCFDCLTRYVDSTAAEE